MERILECGLCVNPIVGNGENPRIKEDGKS